MKTTYVCRFCGEEPSYKPVYCNNCYKKSHYWKHKSIPEERKYTLEEVEVLCNKAINFGYSLNFPEKPLEDFFPKYEKKQEWISKNLDRV